jgi:di/tricarboxylate transporter
MDPRIGKLAFIIGIFILLLGLFILPFLSPSSGEFVVDIMAIIIIIIFLFALVWYIRRETRTIPQESNDFKKDKLKKK